MLIFEGQVAIVGKILSVMVTSNEQVAGVFPAASVYSYVIVVVPIGKAEPEDSPATSAPVNPFPSQLSLNVGKV